MRSRLNQGLFHSRSEIRKAARGALQTGRTAAVSANASSIPATGADTSPVMRLAHLAPGQYSACITKKQVASKGSLAHDPEAAVMCDSGQRAAGTTLMLALQAKD